MFGSENNEYKDSTQEIGEEQKNVVYWVWFVVGVVASVLAAWRQDHYEILSKIAWTIIGPGFTLSQTLKDRKDNFFYLGFGILLLVHIGIMLLIFPNLPKGRFGYVLIAGIVEIMTVGLAFQIWSRLRSKPSDR
jgi:hypothetical protein